MLLDVLVSLLGVSLVTWRISRDTKTRGISQGGLLAWFLPGWFVLGEEIPGESPGMGPESEGSDKWAATNSGSAAEKELFGPNKN